LSMTVRCTKGIIHSMLLTQNTLSGGLAPGRSRPYAREAFAHSTTVETIAHLGLDVRSAVVSEAAGKVVFESRVFLTVSGWARR
jgi:hypothetical protein